MGLNGYHYRTVKRVVVLALDTVETKTEKSRSSRFGVKPKQCLNMHPLTNRFALENKTRPRKLPMLGPLSQNKEYVYDNLGQKAKAE